MLRVDGLWDCVENEMQKSEGNFISDFNFQFLSLLRVDWKKRCIFSLYLSPRCGKCYSMICFQLTFINISNCHAFEKRRKASLMSIVTAHFFVSYINCHVQQIQCCKVQQLWSVLIEFYSTYPNEGSTPNVTCLANNFWRLCIERTNYLSLVHFYIFGFLEPTTTDHVGGLPMLCCLCLYIFRFIFLGFLRNFEAYLYLIEMFETFYDFH